MFFYWLLLAHQKKLKANLNTIKIIAVHNKINNVFKLLLHKKNSKLSNCVSIICITFSFKTLSISGVAIVNAVAKNNIHNHTVISQVIISILVNI